MEKIHIYDKILSPLVTEKSTNLSAENKIVFKVPKNANKKNLKKNIEKIFKVPDKTNKIILKKNIEKIFKVSVTKINIINKQPRKKTVRGKKVKVSGYKKAIITLKKGQNIDLTTGI